MLTFLSTCDSSLVFVCGDEGTDIQSVWYGSDLKLSNPWVFEVKGVEPLFEVWKN